MAQSYLTDRAGSVTLEKINWPGIPRKKKFEDDPERRAEYLRRKSEYNAHYRATDPDFARKMREHMRKFRLQPEIRLYYQEKAKAWRRSQSTKSAFAMSERFRIWIRRYAWFREDLNWVPWQPIFYPDQVEHWCEGCNLARHRGSHLWWRREPQRFRCHSCYMKLPEAGLPEGYEGCTTIKEIAKRKESLKTQSSRPPATSTLTGQSWKPYKKPPTGSRPFSTFHAVWTKSKKQNISPQGLAEDPQSKDLTELEAKMLEAKYQYGQIRSAWKVAKNLESGSQTVTEADVHEAKLQVRRAIYAWKMVSEPGYKARVAASKTRYSRKPESKESKRRWWLHLDNRSRSIENTRFRRANDPLLRLRDMVYDWVWAYPSARRSMIMEAWQPILYSAKVKFHCRGCKYTRDDGLRLWWRRKLDPAVNTDFEVYSCHQ